MLLLTPIYRRVCYTSIQLLFEFWLTTSVRWMPWPTPSTTRTQCYTGFLLSVSFIPPSTPTCAVPAQHLERCQRLSDLVFADKESANCKLECMYAHSARVEMIPMMLQDNCESSD